MTDAPRQGKGPDPPAPGPSRRWRLVRPYGLALLAATAAIALRWLFEPWLNGALPFVTLFGAVALSVWLGGVGPALACMVLGFVAANRWLVGQPGIGLFNAGYGVALLGYGLSCGCIVFFGDALRRTQLALQAEASSRRLAEQQLTESMQHDRHTVELNPQVPWTATPDGQLDRVAERWRQWTGTSGMGDSWGKGLHPDDLDHTVQAWARSVASGVPYDVEHRVRMVGGEYRWARSRAFPRRDASGSIVRWYGATEDIHEGRLAQEALSRLNATLEQQVQTRTAALQASEARMRTIFSTSYQYQGLLTTDGTLLDANATSLAGIGAKLDDVVGKPFWHTPWFTATPGMPETVRQGVLAAARGDSPRQEIVVNLPAGRRVFDFAMRPVPGPDGRPVAIVPEAVDITDRHAAEDKLRQSQKMEAVGQLTGGVAHDFNNLLQVISANLHLIAKYAADNERVQQRLANAQGAVARGARLASQLLAFGRRQALEPKVVNIGRFVTGMEDMLRRSIGEGVDIQTIVSGGLWHTFVDPGQVENAVLNLAINARDAMNGSGKLTIEVSNAVLDDADARAHTDVTPGRYVMVAVTDTGAGMTPEVMAQAFEPFFSTKPAGSGSGLGLSMIYGFVRQSGGHVKIDSEPGKGTTIKLYLPHSHHQEDTVQSLQGGVVAGGAETVLVVEDDNGVRASTVEMLGELGYRVLQAADAAGALTLVESGAAVDLLFTDVVMPGRLTSIDLARRARALLPGMAVLFTSGYTRNAIVHNGRLDGGVELLAKPYTRDALAQRIRHLLDRAAAAGAAARPAAEPAPLNILLVDDDDLVRTTAAEFIQDLGHTVAQARSAQEAMGVLRHTPVDVLVTDVGLPDQAGDVFAAEARMLLPNVRIIFATGTDRLPDVSRMPGAADGGPVLLRKPYDGAALRAALQAARR